MSEAMARDPIAGSRTIAKLSRLVFVAGALLVFIAGIFWAWALYQRFQAGDTIGVTKSPTLVRICRRIAIDTSWQPPPDEPQGGVIISTGSRAPFFQTEFANYYIAVSEGYWTRTDDEAGRYLGPDAGYSNGHIGFATGSVVRIADQNHADTLPIGNGKVTACGILEVPHHPDYEGNEARGHRFILSAIG
jgi:hypothetical protein